MLLLRLRARCIATGLPRPVARDARSQSVSRPSDVSPSRVWRKLDGTKGGVMSILWIILIIVLILALLGFFSRSYW
jgi:hypothetical protein